LKDLAKAVAAYQQAVDAGNTGSMRKLAAILVKGDGVPADAPKAEALLKRAIAAGTSMAPTKRSAIFTAATHR